MKQIIFLLLSLPLLLSAKPRNKHYPKSKRNYVYNHHKGKHGGRYTMGRGSSHKGGRYYSVKTGKHYGRHKS